MSPMDLRKYPKDWKAISAAIRERSGGRCECEGECGLHQPSAAHPEKRRCLERNHTAAEWARGKVVLTVAHLDHDPQNNDPTNLRAMCQRCHNRYDVEHRKVNRARTRRAGRATGDLFSSTHTRQKEEEHDA